MAWTYFCEDDQTTLVADTKEQLADKVIDHSEQRAQYGLDSRAGNGFRE